MTLNLNGTAIVSDNT